MAKDEEKKIDKEEDIAVGLVSLTGEIGIGMKLPGGKIIQLNNIEVGHAQVLEYLVKTISEIKKNIQ